MTINTNQDLDPRQEDRAFNPARRSASEAMASIVRQAVDDFLVTEQRCQPLRRARSEANTEKLNLCTEALITDLVHRVLTMGSDARIHIGLGDHDLGGPVRYRPKAVGMITKKLIQLLSHPDSGPWINFHPRRKEVLERSSLSAGPILLEMIKAARISTQDLTLSDEPAEVIALKKAKDEDDFWWGRPKGTLIAYADTPETHRMREQVEAINAYIGDLDLSIVPPGPRLDLEARILRRVFTQGSPLLDCGGRLWGVHDYPFWYRLRAGKKNGINERQEFLRINGERIAEVDIKACSMTILYALEGLPLPDNGDPYLPGMLATGFPETDAKRRAVMKRLFQASLCRSRRVPVWAEAGDGAVMPCTAEEALTTLENTHAPIAHHLHSGFGHQVQRFESDILVDCLAQAGGRLAALPLHDCLIVPESQAEDAAEALMAAFESHLGQTPQLDW